jgi:hypothetical protein
MPRQVPPHPDFAALDVRKARELVDGFAPPEAPHRELGKPSWFGCDADRRTYWLQHAAEIVTWARNRSFGPAQAALRYGVPHEAHLAVWTSAA